MWLALWFAQCPTRADDSPNQLLAQSEQTLERSGPESALPLYERALAVSRSANDPLSEQRALRGIGACQRRLGSYEKALDTLQEALSVARAVNARLDEGKTLSQIGLVYWELGNYAGAERHFQQAIEIAHQQKDQHLEASALNNLSLVNDERGRYADSIRGYERALALYAEKSFPRGESDTLSNVGGVHLLLGNFDEALRYYERALAIDRARQDAPAIGTDLGNMGLALQGLGKYDEAGASLQQAIEAARTSGQKVDEAFWLKGSAGVQLNLGRYDLALEQHRQALALYEQAGSQGEHLEALADFGELLLRLGDLGGAEEQFTRAIGLARKIGHHRGETQALMRLGDLQRARHQDHDAIASYRLALARAEAIEDRTRTVEAQVQLASTLAHNGEREEAQRLAARALQESEHTKQPWFAARAQLELAALAEAAQELGSARTGFGAALDTAQRLGDPDLLWRSRFGLGRVLAASGQTEKAISELERAVETIEGVRSQLHQRRFRSGYLDDKYEVYVELVRLLLESGNVQRAFSVSEDLRAQAFHDLQTSPSSTLQDAALAQRERALRERIATLQGNLEREREKPGDERRESALSTYSVELASAERAYTALLDEGYAPVTTPPPAPDESALRKRMRPDEALLEFVVGARGITVFVLDATGLRATRIDARRSELRARIELLRELMLDPSSAAWRKPARALGQQLIEPLARAGWLAATKQLHIVPDAELNYLPFAALLVGDDVDPHPLVNDAIVRILPSAAMLGTAESAAHASPSRLLALAPEAARLRHAGAEARAVAELHGANAEVWAGTEATEHRFKLEAGNYDRLHVATHGEFNNLNPAFSALELEAGEGDDGKLRVQEILELRLNAELVTLSACDTALGSGYFSDVPVGNEFIGLTRAFLQAGSRGVLSSLWAVDDRFTSRFMVDFYRATAQLGFAAGLAQAQRQLVQAGGAYSHPYYWAPYVLIGGANGGHDGGKTASASVSSSAAGRKTLHGAVNAARE